MFHDISANILQVLSRNFSLLLLIQGIKISPGQSGEHVMYCSPFHIKVS